MEWVYGFILILYRTRLAIANIVPPNYHDCMSDPSKRFAIGFVAIYLCVAILVFFAPFQDVSHSSLQESFGYLLPIVFLAWLISRPLSAEESFFAIVAHQILFIVYTFALHPSFLMVYWPRMVSLLYDFELAARIIPSILVIYIVRKYMFLLNTAFNLKRGMLLGLLAIFIQFAFSLGMSPIFLVILSLAGPLFLLNEWSLDRIAKKKTLRGSTTRVVDQKAA
jgi:hypothetical protein